MTHPLTGRKQNPEHVKRRIEAVRKSGVYERRRGRRLSEEHRRKISEGAKRVGSGKWMLGRKLSKNWRDAIGAGNKGKKYSDEAREKIGSKKRGKPLFSIRGVNHWNWKGGVSTEHEYIRKSLEMSLWRRAVLIRDNYTCQLCGCRGGRLEADHIKPFSLYPKLRFAIDNGRALCRPCHMKTDTYSGRISKLKIETI